MLIHRTVFFTRVYAHEYVGIEILAGIFQVEVKKRAWYFTFLRNAFPLLSLLEYCESPRNENFYKCKIS